jgi:hypothetical protein
MTKLLDRVLGMSAKADVSAGCAPETEHQKRIDCRSGTYMQTCYRTCSYSSNCTYHCTSWSGCKCVAADAGWC